MKQILKMLIISFVLQVFNVFASFSVAATFPQDLEYSLYSDVLIDAGYIWQINSTFHPFTSQLPDSNKSNCSSLDAFSWMNRYLNDYSCKSAKVHKKTVDGLSIIMIPGLGLAKQTGEASIYDQMAMQPFFWTEASLQNNWYARLYLRFTNEVNSLPHYTGIRRDIARIGLNTGESDQALLGYKNKWAQIEYGRSREIWGFLASENLLLSGNSPPYEKLTLQLNYRHFTYRWFYGFLESRVSSDGLNINRYLAGRVLEYRNKHNFVMSVGEISVLAGPNRPLDWAFLNPLALHIEIEQNERENDVVANHSNGILFINTDWMVNPSLRLAGSLIIDDFQLDQKDRDEGDPDPVGCMAHIAWTPIKRHLGVTFFCNYIRIGTYTLPHSYRYTNLVSRGEMIGHPISNDADDYNLGIRISSTYRLLIEIKFGERRWGDSSMLFDPYKSQSGSRHGSFPSGHVRTNKYLILKSRTIPFKNFSVGIDSHIDLKHSGEASVLEYLTFSVRYQFSFLIINI